MAARYVLPASLEDPGVNKPRSTGDPAAISPLATTARKLKLVHERVWRRRN
jgi:hypothetical protein